MVLDIVQVLAFCVPLVHFSTTIGEDAGSLTLSTKHPAEERLSSGAKFASSRIEVSAAMTQVQVSNPRRYTWIHSCIVSHALDFVL
jgi:hypothetical protein